MKRMVLENGLVMEFAEEGDQEIKFEGSPYHCAWYLDSEYGLVRVTGRSDLVQGGVQWNGSLISDYLNYYV